MLNLGIVKPGTTIYVPFATYDSNDPSASVTLTGLATTDIEVYKDGSVTQRASDAGYTLLDTDGIDFDATTGIHGFSINLADNTTAGFYASGSQYFVVVASITVDAATVNFIAARFEIGYPDALLNTTIATLASQTSFTLTVGPAEDDALNGCIVAIHDVASAVQMGFAVVLDYTGSTKTVTLTAGTTFTAAATDNIAFYPPVNVTHIGATAQTANDNGADINEILTDTGTTLDGRIPAALVGGRIDANVGAISGDATAADNAEAFFDGTGYAGTNNVIPAVTTTTNLTNAPTAGDLTATMKTSVQTAAAAALDAENGANFTAIPWNAAWDAEVQSEVEDALVVHRLDELLNADSDIDGAAPPTVGSVFHELLTKTAGSFTYDQTTDSLEAVRDRGDAAWVTATGFSTHSAADVWSVATRVLTAGTNVNGSTFTAIPWNAAWDAEVQSEVQDALDAAVAEPGQGTPAANASISTKISFVYKAWRNRTTQTATEYALYGDDGVTKDQEAALSDDTVTLVKGEVATGA